MRQFNRQSTTIGICAFAAIVALLIVIPPWISVNGEIRSAASHLGYSTFAASMLVTAWSILLVIITAVFYWFRGRDDSESDTESPMELPHGRIRWGELFAVFSIFVICYMPFFIARYGPYSEDNYFLSVMNRMSAGQVPFRDFAFLYGPLMAYPLHLWTKLFGYSMTSYYGFIAIFEGLQFALLMGVLQRFIPDRRRYLVFLLLLPFLLNTMMGLNWNGMRRLWAVLISLIVVVHPYRRTSIILASVLLGAYIAYSHEYAAATLVALVAVYGTCFLRGEGWRTVQSAIVLTVGSVVTWALLSLFMLGTNFPYYIEHVRQVYERMSAGHQGFPFHWTANSLSLFALLTIACVAVGAGVLKRRDQELLSGDRLLLGGLCFTIIALKSGFTRSDHWHLNAPFLILFFAFLLPLPRGVFRISTRGRRLAFGLLFIISGTYALGIYNTADQIAMSYVQGARDWWSGTDRPARVRTRVHSIEFERTHAREDTVRLGEFLAQGEVAERDVYFYAQFWKLPPRAGVVPVNYALADDIMFEKDKDFLKEHPDALVVMHNQTYKRLFGLEAVKTKDPRLAPSLSRTLSRWLTTSHLGAIEAEQLMEQQQWDQLIGSHIRSHYELLERFGPLVVLVRATVSND